MKKLILGASIALFSVVSLISIGNNNELQVNQALAGGTCCDQEKAKCYPGNCSSPTCADFNAYWKSDGTKCPASIAL